MGRQLNHTHNGGKLKKIIVITTLFVLGSSIFCFVHRPATLSERHLPNEWIDFIQEWDDLSWECNYWLFRPFYASELEYIDKARGIYNDWRNPEMPSHEEMKRLYESYSGLFPEIYNNQIKKNKEKINYAIGQLMINPGGAALSTGSLMAENTLLKIQGIYEPTEKKNKIRKEFYALDDEYNKKMKEREAKMKQPERVIFKRLLDLREKYTTGESLPPILNRERKKPEGVAKLKAEKDIFKYRQ